MKEKLFNILTLILALGQCPKENEDEAAKIQEMIEGEQAAIRTIHGDDELNDEAIHETINNISIVLGSSQPDPDHAEVPQFEEETDDGSDAGPLAEGEEEAVETEEEEKETREAAEAEAEEQRLAAEEEEKKKATAAAAAAPKLTIKQKREMAERAATAAKPTPPPKRVLKK